MGEGDITNKRKDFFISYVSTDKPWAEWIAWCLEDAGYSVYLPAWDLLPGSNEVIGIDSATRMAERIIVVLSHDDPSSDIVSAQWATALRRDPKGEQRSLLPVRVQSCDIKGLLGSVMCIDLVGRDEQDAHACLLQGVLRERRKPSFVPFPVPPASYKAEQERPAFPGALPPFWNIPYARNRHFTGRGALLDQLHQQLTSTSHNCLGHTCRAALMQPQAIKGLGGIGKTQIAVEYAYRHSQDYQVQLWTRADTDDALVSGYVAIAQLLHLSEKDEQDQSLAVNAVLHWLNTHTQWLLILDNADDLALVQKYLPQPGNGSVLLTTRANTVNAVASSIEVEKMDLMEASCLLLRRVYDFAHLSIEEIWESVSDESVNEAGTIVAALDYLPLAIDQAGAYIEETGCSFARYLQIYQDHHKELLAQRGMQVTNYPDSVATTWSLSFQKIEQANPAAADLLRLCAFLAPDKIPEELIRDGVVFWSPLLQQAAADLFAFNQMMADLLKFSLIKRLREEQAISLHRLVQAVQLDMMEPAARCQWAERIIRAVNGVVPFTKKDEAAYIQCLRCLDQVQACEHLIRHYRFTDTEAVKLLNQASLFLGTRARLYTLAEPLSLHALAICEQHLEAQHPETATTLNTLACVYKEQRKRLAEAEPLFLRALAIREQRLGETHPETATTLNNLAGIYKELKRSSEAESLYQRALTIREQRLGSEHLETATSLNDLAHLYDEQERYAEAEPLYQRALAICEQLLGPQHPDTVALLNDLTGFYYDQEKYEEAEPFCLRVLAIREQQIGPEHLDTATTLNNLAYLYQKQGKYKEAEPLYQRALAIREKQLGPDHLDTASILDNLASFYDEQGQYAEAEVLLRRVLAIYESGLGQNHSTTQATREEYTALLRTITCDDQVR